MQRLIRWIRLGDIVDLKTKILLVDDRLENLIALEDTLDELGVEFVRALSGNEAVAETLRSDFALILMDVQMPDMDGFEALEFIRKEKKNEHVPVIYLSAIYSDEFYKVKGVRSGGIDFIAKPVNDEILLGKVRMFLKLHHQKTVIEQTNLQLSDANMKILEQQQALMEEERIKVMLKMAGATAHEFSQPLSALMGCVDLLEVEGSEPDKILEYLPIMKEAGQRLAGTLKKMRTINNPGLAGQNQPTPQARLSREVSILNVEDSDADFNRLVSVLKDFENINLVRAKSIQDALHQLAGGKFDLIFLDYYLSDGNGLDMIKLLESKGYAIPVVVISGHGDDQVASECIRQGAFDYLPKINISQAPLQRIIVNTLDKVQFKNELDLSLKRMADMSTMDELTGLYNRRFMHEMLEKEFARTRRFGTRMAGLMIDLDYFKNINDTYGHACGDHVLKTFAELLQGYARKSDYYFRYGGEEFFILLPQVDCEGARVFAEKICSACSKRDFTCSSVSIPVTVSIGIASVEHCSGEHSLELFEHADKAMYRAKADGRNCVRVFEPAD
ncbi:MAG: diguanylate cyclase [Deltaproteobacteria bacterium]|nr:diguanylate cyclase [Deltaproteobacteria bacterium]